MRKQHPKNTVDRQALGISFGKTRDRLHQKSVTRRRWSERRAKTFAKYFHDNREIPALDKDRRFGGEQIGTLWLTEAPYQEQLSQMAESEVAAEGYPELSKEQFIDRFFDGDGSCMVWVIRFRFVPLSTFSQP